MQITRQGITSSLPAAELNQQRQRFAAQHCLLLPGILEPYLFNTVRTHLASAIFAERVHEGIGSELSAGPGPAPTILEFLFNQPSVLRFVEAVCDQPAIGCFAGRVYRMVPATGQNFSWHDDFDELPERLPDLETDPEPRGRLIALSLNLSEQPYCGGLLQIRERSSGKIVHEVQNTGLGDALLFRLAPTLEHRVTDVTGTAAKTALAGWFHRWPDYPALLAHGLGYAEPLA